MKTRLGLDQAERPWIAWGNRVLVSNLQVALEPWRNPEDSGSVIAASPWERIEGSEHSGVVRALRQHLSLDGRPLADVTLEVHGDIVRFAVTLTRSIDGLAVGDSFEASSIHMPRFTFPEDARFLLVTHGLGDSGDGGIGGYWPEAQTGQGMAALPREAFSPLVIFEENAAIAVAPGSQFLTSTLVGGSDGVYRGLHGSVDRLPTELCIETFFAGADSMADALLALGDHLLSKGGKRRPEPGANIVTSQIGWWNAYGGHYTEPIHPLSAEALSTVLEDLESREAAPGYVGIDLWYPYAEIGQALRFSPDPAKYPAGLAPIAKRFGIPTVLHLSALASANTYAASGSDPGIYREIAAELERQHAIVAWHDWLRTQQHLTSSLRSDPRTAEEWFSGLAGELDGRSLQILLCMQTMGMVLASTALSNITSARSAIDYLFAQETAMETLTRIGHGGFRNDETTMHVMRRQNLLVGFVLYALGLLPFHDLFLTQCDPELGGRSPHAEAVLRALSCGPVGIGDGPGRADLDLVRALVSAEGRLLQPDRTPIPDPETLGHPVEIYRTEHQAGDLCWAYVIALNTTGVDQMFDIPAPDDVLIWDGSAERAVARMAGSLPPAEIAYFVLVPMRDGLAPLGLRSKLVPSPAQVIQSASWEPTLRIDLYAPGDALAIHATANLTFSDQTQRTLTARRDGNLWEVELDKAVRTVNVFRR